MWKLGKEATEFSRLKNRRINSNKLRRPQFMEEEIQVLRISTLY